MSKVSIAPDWVFSPQPMYIIGTRNEDGTPNFCIITWLGFSFDKTPHLMMTVGGTKRTKTNLLRDGRFSACMITQDILWLADYFGSTSGDEGVKDALPYTCTRGQVLDVPVIAQSPWVYECEVDRVTQLDGAHLFLCDIRNILIDERYADMDLKRIDLARLRPVIYAPYRYFSIGQPLGDMGEWRGHMPHA